MPESDEKELLEDVKMFPDLSLMALSKWYRLGVKKAEAIIKNNQQSLTDAQNRFMLI